jgi:cutinase
MGKDDILGRLNSQNKLCPEQKFVLVGYSQGAGVVHGVFGPTGAAMPGLRNPRPELDKSVIPKILAVALFGDPGFKGTTGPTGATIPVFPSEIQAKMIQNCAPGDPVCDPKGSTGLKHLDYAKNPYQSQSIAFILAAFKGEALPKTIKSANDQEWIANAENTRPKPAAKGEVAPKRMVQI